MNDRCENPSALIKGTKGNKLTAGRKRAVRPNNGVLATPHLHKIIGRPLSDRRSGESCGRNPRMIRTPNLRKWLRDWTKANTP